MAFLLFAVVAAVTPGPSNIMLTAAGAQAGVLRGLPCLFGVATGMGAMMFVVPLGLGSLVLERPLVLKALHWGGAAFLLWLSWKIATSGSRSDSAPDPVGYLGAAIFQWVNPKSWLVTASAAGTFLSAGAGSRSCRPPPSRASSSWPPCRVAFCGWRSEPLSITSFTVVADCESSTLRWACFSRYRSPSSSGESASADGPAPAARSGVGCAQTVPGSIATERKQEGTGTQ